MLLIAFGPMLFMLGLAVGHYMGCGCGCRARDREGW